MIRVLIRRGDETVAVPLEEYQEACKNLRGCEPPEDEAPDDEPE